LEEEEEEEEEEGGLAVTDRRLSAWDMEWPRFGNDVE
jgi:hypothetical protein